MQSRQVGKDRISILQNNDVFVINPSINYMQLVQFFNPKHYSSNQKSKIALKIQSEFCMQLWAYTFSCVCIEMFIVSEIEV